jgi:hypothetical protein
MPAKCNAAKMKNKIQEMGISPAEALQTKGLIQGFQPKSGSWTGWSVRFLGCRARRNDAEWSFHSKELQRSHAP